MARSALLEVPAAVSPAVHIEESYSAEEVYEQLTYVEHLHVELLFGRVVVTGSGSVRHGQVICLLFRWLDDLARLMGWVTYQHQAVHIKATRDRILPDIAVAPMNAPQYDPNELFADGLFLAAEVVSPTSKNDDRRDKPVIYAQGQVPLYLLVDIEANPQSVTLFSDPVGGRYQARRTVRVGEPLALPEPFGSTLDTGLLRVG